MAVNLAPLLARRTPFFYGWVVLFAAGTSNFVRNAAASLTIAVFVYPLSQELGWSRTLIAGAASLGGLAATFASPAVGRAVDRFGARSVLTLSVFVLGLATISLAWATATVTLFGAAVPWAFYLACATGRVIFSSPVPIATSVVVSRWFVRMRGRVNGMLSAAHSAGMILFPLLASVIIARDGWREAWVVLGLVVWGAALLPAWLLMAESPEDVDLRPDGDAADSPEDSPSPEEEPAWTLAEAVRTPALWILAVGTGALFLIQAGTNTHAAAFFRDQGLDAATAGLAISLNAAFLGIGGLVWGRVVEGCSPRYVMAAVALVMAAGSALFVTVDTAVEALVCSSIFGFGLGGMLTVPPVALADYFGRRSLGAVRGVTEPFTTFGQAVGALVPGVVFDHLTAPGAQSYVPAFAAFAVLGARHRAHAPARPAAPKAGRGRMKGRP